MLLVALIINLLIIYLDALVLIKIKKKIDILRYYTYFQNLLSLLVSIILSIYLIIYFINGNIINEYVKGLRYTVTCGLISTSLIYTLFISKNEENKLNEEDFNNFNYKVANLLLHYIIPILSLISFTIFERKIHINNSIWTILCAVPSIAYWAIYLILSASHLWKEPYNFKTKKQNVLLEVITFIFIPLSFIFISIIIWNIM